MKPILEKILLIDDDQILKKGRAKIFISLIFGVIVLFSAVIWLFLTELIFGDVFKINNETINDDLILNLKLMNYLSRAFILVLFSIGFLLIIHSGVLAKLREATLKLKNTRV